MTERPTLAECQRAYEALHASLKAHHNSPVYIPEHPDTINAAQAAIVRLEKVMKVLREAEAPREAEESREENNAHLRAIIQSLSEERLHGVPETFMGIPIEEAAQIIAKDLRKNPRRPS